MSKRYTDHAAMIAISRIMITEAMVLVFSDFKIVAILT